MIVFFYATLGISRMCAPVSLPVPDITVSLPIIQSRSQMAGLGHRPFIPDRP